MTADELAKLADSELDAMAAERVMGWVHDRKTWRLPSGETVCLEWDWLPTKVIADAFRLVDAVRAKRPEWRHWLVEWDDTFHSKWDDGDREYADVRDKSRCRAIVIACLLACGPEGSQ